MRIAMLLVGLTVWIGASAETVIHAGDLFDSKNRTILEARTIVVEGDCPSSMLKR